MIRGVIEGNLDHIYRESNHLTWKKLLMSEGEVDSSKTRMPTLGLTPLAAGTMGLDRRGPGCLL